MSLEVFTKYALAFQKNVVPEVEEVMVKRVEREGDWFDLQLASGVTLRARTVIVATGLEHAVHFPREMADLAPELLSHSSEHHDLSGFAGKDVIVIGGGQSALETAALLSEQGAGVRLLVRAPSIVWNSYPRGEKQSWYDRVRRPASGLGRGTVGLRERAVVVPIFAPFDAL